MTTTALERARPSARLREETLDIHRQTEAEPFVVELLDGRRDADAFAALQGQLAWVYAALEAAVADARPTAPPALAALYDPRLERAATLAADRRILGRPEADPPLPATQAYVERIGHAAASAWPRLLAHHYVRYLGDLSGGQVVATMVQRHYGIPHEALTFYAFDGIPSKGAFKRTYREGLDALLDDGAAYTAALDETRAAYAANRDLFIALDGAGA